MDDYTRAACVVIKNKKNKDVVLLIKNGRYDLPAGKLKTTETFKEGAIREVMEETGLDVSNLNEVHTEMIGKCKVKTFITTVYKNELYTDEDHELLWGKIENIKKTKNEWLGYNEKIINITNLYFQQK